MNDATQKNFLDLRKAFNDAKRSLRQIVDSTYTINATWTDMTVTGYPRNSPFVTTNLKAFDSSTWPAPSEIVKAWVDCNRGFRDLKLAYDQLGADDKDYLGLPGAPGP